MPHKISFAEYKLYSPKWWDNYITATRGENCNLMPDTGRFLSFTERNYRIKFCFDEIGIEFESEEDAVAFILKWS